MTYPPQMNETIIRMDKMITVEVFFPNGSGFLKYTI